MKPESNAEPYEFYLDGEPAGCGRFVPEVTASEAAAVVRCGTWERIKKAPGGLENPLGAGRPKRPYHEDAVIIPCGRSTCKGVFW